MAKKSNRFNDYDDEDDDSFNEDDLFDVDDLPADDEDGPSNDDEEYDDIQALLDEGLEPKKPKRKMNPKSLENLKRGGIDENMKKDKLSRREQEIQRRLDQLRDDPQNYYKETLMKNLVKEEINLEELQDDLTNTYGSGNQQRVRNMIYSTIQSLLLLGDALKAMPKQNKEEDKKSVAAAAEVYEEFRKSKPPEIANNADKMREELEKLKTEYKDHLDKGDTK